MAEEDRPREVTPERRVAQRQLEKRRLTPPIPVDAIAREYFDVEETYVPAECDAILRGLGATGRPSIIVNTAQSPLRRRFTLAHELGHYFISWHLGTIICHADPAYETEDALAYEVLYDMESEANAFASEFLFPRDWVQTVIDEAGSFPAALAALDVAQISAPAACYSLSEMLEPGHVLVLMDGAGGARYTFKSTDTKANAPYRGESVDLRTLDRQATESARVGFAGQTIYWWYFESAAALLPDGRDPKALLRGILADVIRDRDEEARLYQQIQAITASAKGSVQDRSAEALFALFRQRFAQRAPLAGVVAHPDFDAFLSRRAEELGEPK